MGMIEEAVDEVLHFKAVKRKLWEEWCQHCCEGKMTLAEEKQEQMMDARSRYQLALEVYFKITTDNKAFQEGGM